MMEEASNSAVPRIAERQRLHVGIVMFHGQTALDLVGPQLAFAAAGMTVHLISDTLEPVVADTGISVVPTVTMAECPVGMDILFVPGGRVDDLLLDSAKVAFIAERGAEASYVTSVCTGSLVLAAAGLLEGYRASTHWALRSQLARLGVEVSAERVCVDRNRMTGGGVTAGIDFGLTVIARVLGEETARFVQLAMEYDPQPPFNAGSPECAGEATVATFHRLGPASDGGTERAVTQVLRQRTAPRGSSAPRGPGGGAGRRLT